MFMTTSSKPRLAGGKRLGFALPAWALVLALSLAGTLPAGATGTLDQSQTTHVLNAGWSVIGGTTWSAQTFTAGLTGSLDQVDLLLTKFFDPPGDVVVEIRDISGVVPASTVLASATVLETNIAFSTPVSVPLSPPAPVVAGTQYAIVLHSPGGVSGANYGAGQAATNPYAGGQRLISSNSGATWALSGITYNPNLDLVFKTYVDTIAVPDTTPPETAIVSAVDGDGMSLLGGGPTLSSSAVVTFSGSDNVGVAGFECSTDGGAFTGCSSPQALAGLGASSHSLSVRAMDAAGNVDASPASVAWDVLTPAQASEHLIDVINGMGLPNGVSNSLLGPLHEAAALLSDGNPNNDAGACGKLGAFLNQVAAKEAAGQLTAAQAAELRRLAAALRAALGC